MQAACTKDAINVASHTAKVGIWPSIMCSKPWDVKTYIEAFERVGLTGIHFDVMDGHYVPNLMLSPEEFRAMSSITSLPIEVHAATTEPERFFTFFDLRPGDRYSFHPEVAMQPYRLLEQVRAHGCKAGLAISPGVPVSYLTECLGVLDFVTVMAVSPGFAGQTMSVDHLSKLARIKAICEQADHPIDIVVDGNTSIANARKMLAAGATALVTGTSFMFNDCPEDFERLYWEYMAAICAE